MEDARILSYYSDNFLAAMGEHPCDLPSRKQVHVAVKSGSWRPTSSCSAVVGRGLSRSHSLSGWHLGPTTSPGMRLSNAQPLLQSPSIPPLRWPKPCQVYIRVQVFCSVLLSPSFHPQVSDQDCGMKAFSAQSHFLPLIFHRHEPPINLLHS